MPKSDAASLVAQAEAAVLARIGDHVWARGDTSWPAAIEAALLRRRWRLAILEIATRGAVAGLLAEGLGDRLVQASILTDTTSS